MLLSRPTDAVAAERIRQGPGGAPDERPLQGTSASGAQSTTWRLSLMWSLLLLIVDCSSDYD
jgi:hypothetical protein